MCDRRRACIHRRSGLPRCGYLYPVKLSRHYSGETARKRLERPRKPRPWHRRGCRRSVRYSRRRAVGVRMVVRIRSKVNICRPCTRGL